MGGFAVPPVAMPNEGVPAANINFGPPLFGFGQGFFNFGLGPLGMGRGNLQQPQGVGDNLTTLFAFARRNLKPTRGRNSQVGHNLRPPDWSKIDLPTCHKDLYREDFRTALRSTVEVEAYREANEIIVTGRGVPKPILHVDEAGFPDFVKKVVEARNAGSSPAALQAQCWPIALSGRDLVAVVDSPASEGKSLAYLVPAIVHLQHQPAVLHGGGPVVLVLTATREVAQNVRATAEELSERSGIRTAYVVSGFPKEPQRRQLEDGAEICIATPGRLVAFMEDCKVNLHRCTYLVLDEVDRMVAMGFRKQLCAIANNTRPDRQTLVWLSSRTLESHRLVEELAKDYVTVSVGTVTPEYKNRQIEHIVYFCEKADKEDELIALLKDILKEESDKAIVFVETKKTVEELTWSMRLQGWLAVGIHSSKTEREREWALNALRFGKARVLVATDMIAKALHLDNVRFVVSYDCPSNPGEYSRRFEHAARLDGTGRKYTFLEPGDSAHARELMWFLQDAKLAIPAQLRKVAKQVTRK